MQKDKFVTNWDPYLQYGQRQFYRQKEIIYSENEAGTTGFYYLQKGLIKISTTIHTGKSCIIDIVSDDKPFGEQATDGELYFSTASAMEDSIVYYFPDEIIAEMTQEAPDFNMLFYHSLTEKLETLSNNLLFYSLPSEKILARTLLKLKDKYVSEKIPFTQTELSKYSNLNRITVYQIFKKWDTPIVSIQNKKIQINNVQALENIAII